MDTVQMVDPTRRKQIEEAESWLGRFKAEKFPMNAAFWVKRPDEERWQLYVATPDREKLGPTKAYGKVQDALRHLGESGLRASDAIRLVSPKDELVGDVLDFQKRFPDLTRQELKEQHLGSKTFDIYIYPLEEVPITLYGMYFEEGPRPALHLAFEPHNPNAKMIVEQANQGPVEYVAKTGQDYLVATPEGARLERNEDQMLALSTQVSGRKVSLTPNTVYAFAQLGLHGFRILREPVRPVLFDTSK